MSVVKNTVLCPPAGSEFQSSSVLDLPQPQLRVAPTRLVQLCYAMVHAAEAVGIHDLAELARLPNELKTIQRGMIYPVGISHPLRDLAAEVDERSPG
jgi:hypothetical protein